MVKLQNFFKILISLILIFQVSSKGIGGIDNRIVGGDEASNDYQFPYAVSVQGNNVLCGGSIISKNYVLTAAHCVSRFKASNITIRAGTIHLREAGVTVGVSEVKVHPDFHDAFNYDIALLKLSNSLEFDGALQPIKLATENPEPGSDVVVTGWGGIYSGGPISLTLKYDYMKAVSIDECRQLLRPLPSEVICFVRPSGNGICGGDSGGAAVSRNRLVGVAIYNVNNCGDGFPDGFSSVADLNQWIRDNSDL